MSDLTPQQLAKLARIANYSTRYEVELVHLDTGERRLLCYTRKTERGIRDYIFRHAAEVVTFCGSDRLFKLSIGRWRIAFTGRTQREAIMAGELPWFGTKD